MASAAAVEALSAAETAYEIAYHVAEMKKNPPGQRNVNSRQLKAALAEVRVTWAELEAAQLNYHDKFVSPDDDTKTTDWNSWLEKEAVHDALVESVVTTLGLELSPAQRKARLFAQVANKEASLTEMADSLLTSLDDDTKTFSKPLLDYYDQECDNMLAELFGSLVTLYSNREEKDKVNWEEHNQSANVFIMGFKSKVRLIQAKIAARADTGHVIDGDHVGDSSNRAAYERGDLQPYEGTIREYQDIDLSSCVTLEETWPAFLEAEEIATEIAGRCERRLFAMDNTVVKAATYVEQEEEVYHDAFVTRGGGW